jgi:hypothetical protein
MHGHERAREPIVVVAFSPPPPRTPRVCGSCVARFTFTFTLICHVGKTHNHRPRGDPAWGAQSAAHTHTETHTRATLRHKHRIEQKEEGGRECQGGEGGGQGGQLTFTDIARANV